MRRKPQITSRWIAPLASLALLAGIVAARAQQPTPDDADPFHARVRETVMDIPYQIGDWAGEDQPVPRAAVALLKPNVLFNRTYRRLGTGQAATLMIVQCRDARDLAGHYPPVCYVGNGWQHESADPVVVEIDRRKITATEYTFRFEGARGLSRISILNFMILPDGRVTRDMTGVRGAASDYRRRFFGAAQVQLITDAGVTEPDRRAIFDQLIAANSDAIWSMGSASTP